MILKPFHEITLKDVILLDATKSANVLKKYWFIPLFLCRKELESLAKQIFEAIGGKTASNLQDEFDKLHQYRKLQIYEALYKAVQIEFGLKAKINAWKIILQKDYTESPQLGKVISEVERITGIKIETPDDLKTFNDWGLHKIDKFNEMFPVEDISEKEQVSIIAIFNSYFMAVNRSLDESMRFVVFLDMKKSIDDRMKSQNKEENEYV